MPGPLPAQQMALPGCLLRQVRFALVVAAWGSTFQRAETIKVLPGTQVAVRGAGNGTFNGNYTAVDTCHDRGIYNGSRVVLIMDGDANVVIQWFPASYDGNLSWPAAWYFVTMPGAIGSYYVPTLSEALLPETNWSIWSGDLSSPGNAPPPSIWYVSGDAMAPAACEVGLPIVSSIGTKLEVRGAGTSMFDGNYTAVDTCIDTNEHNGSRVVFLKDDDPTYVLKWYPNNSNNESSWPAAWYLETLPDGIASYYLPWASDTMLPQAKWLVWSGGYSATVARATPIIRFVSFDASGPPACTVGLPVVTLIGTKVEVRGAGTVAFNGNYTVSDTCVDTSGYNGSRVAFLKDGNPTYYLKWYPSNSGDGSSWPAAWYLETLPDGLGSYYLPSDRDDTLPQAKWFVWSGDYSAPGRAPMPTTWFVSLDQSAPPACTVGPPILSRIGTKVEVRGADYVAFNGNYSAVDTCNDTNYYGSRVAFLKDGDPTYAFKWYASNSGEGTSWPAAWYLETLPDELASYYMPSVSDALFPQAKWRVWTGDFSDPVFGQSPTTRVLSFNESAPPACTVGLPVISRIGTNIEVRGAGSMAFNGNYTAVDTCVATNANTGSRVVFLKDGDPTYAFIWYPGSSGEGTSWPAAWYLETLPDELGTYYLPSVSDALFPQAKWLIWSGDFSTPVSGATPTTRLTSWNPSASSSCDQAAALLRTTATASTQQSSAPIWTALALAVCVAAATTRPSRT